MKFRNHEIVIPALREGQEPQRHTITVPVREEDGMEFLTPEAMTIIESVQSQMMLTRLVNTVREMNGLPINLSGTLGIDRTQNAANVATPAEVPASLKPV